MFLSLKGCNVYCSQAVVKKTDDGDKTSWFRVSQKQIFNVLGNRIRKIKKERKTSEQFFELSV